MSFCRRPLKKYENSDTVCCAVLLSQHMHAVHPIILSRPFTALSKYMKFVLSSRPVVLNSKKNITILYFFFGRFDSKVMKILFNTNMLSWWPLWKQSFCNACFGILQDQSVIKFLRRWHRWRHFKWGYAITLLRTIDYLFSNSEMI